MAKLLRYTGKDLQNIKFEDWLQSKPETLRPIGLIWFDVIKKSGDDVQDIFHDGYPMGCLDQAPFAYVNIFKNHVNVGFFYGAQLPDKNRLLEGTGKWMRHIKSRPEWPSDEDAISELIYASYLDLKERLNSEI